MRIQFPVETWIEILDWLKRRDLLKKFDQLWDREFTTIVQDWFHKYTRNVRLGELYAIDDGFMNEEGEAIPFAEVELPKNITNFYWITISHLDSATLAFLHRIRPLFRNIHLGIYNYTNNAKVELPIRTAIRLIMPMINNGSIDSLALNYQLLQFFSASHPSALLNAKWLQIWNGFKQNTNVSEQLLVNWLFTQREEGQARTLLLFECTAGFWEKIRERFLDTARQSASPFFVRMRNNLPMESVIENSRTGEQLTTVNGNGVFSYGLIINCPVNVDPEWLAKKEEEMREWDFHNQQQVIWLSSSLEIGPLEDEDQQNAEEAN